MRNSKPTEYVEVEVIIHFKTVKAAKMSLDGDEDSAVWVPLSQTKGRIEKSDKPQTVEIADWIAEREGLV